MVRPRKLMLLAAAAVAVVRHGRRAARGHQVAGRILIGDAVVYDMLSRLLLGRFVGRIAADISAVAPDGARVLEVGSGPGHLSVRLVRQHGLEVTGLDLDPAMIARAQSNADRPGTGDLGRPSFLVGDVVALAFPDRSFDLVVSTLSMHHLAGPHGGLGGDRPCAAPRPPDPGLGFPAWRPATSVRTTPCAHPGSGRTHPWRSATAGQRHAMALALDVGPQPANRAGPCGWVTRTFGPSSDLT